MVQINDGTGGGNSQKVDGLNRALVKAITEEELEESAERGDAYGWAGTSYNYAAADTIMAVKNTDTNKDLHMTRACLYSDTATVAQVHIITAAYTSAGTEITGTNLNAGSNNVANAEAYQDETGNTQGSIIYTVFVKAGETLCLPLNVILGQNHAVAVDYVTVGTAAFASMVGHYEDPND